MPSWWDWVVYRYFWKRWKKHYQVNIRLTAIHIAKMDALHVKVPQKTPQALDMGEDIEYYEEP